MKDLSDFFDIVGGLEDLRAAIPASSSDRISGIARTMSPILAGASWRRQYYSFAIVQIYSTHERFIRDLVTVTTRLMKDLYSTYESLPDVLKREHLMLTLKRLQDMAQGNPLDPVILRNEISDLVACFDGVIALNEEAMAKHTSNFRSGTVRQVLSRLDFKLEDCGTDAEGFGEFPFGVLVGLYATAESVLDDLANRRNDVAHGSDSEIVDIDTLRAIAETIYRYDLWLFRTMARSHLSGLVEREAVEVGTIDHAWTNRATNVRSIGRLNDLSSDLRPGAFGYVVKNKVQICTVGEIQVDNQRIAVATSGAGPFAVDLGVPIKTGSSFKVIPVALSRLERILLEATKEGKNVELVV
ncbi:MAE_28990/MAE_18760 family HEPN-like nuclease [Nocardia sp. NPDC056541]|uniref:MAE_28990/MAE_18760 family HEPN-like nuclease n=1 Tax=Nocardia sp. NPDC056541 TaxID=3345860 RepID=UPI00366DEC3A